MERAWNMDNTIYVTRFPEDVTRRDLDVHFSRYGNITHFYLQTTNSPPFSIIEFEDSSSAERAISGGNGFPFFSHFLQVQSGHHMKQKQLQPTSPHNVRQSLQKPKIWQIKKKDSVSCANDAMETKLKHDGSVPQSSALFRASFPVTTIHSLDNSRGRVCSSERSISTNAPEKSTSSRATIWPCSFKTFVETRRLVKFKWLFNKRRCLLPTKVGAKILSSGINHIIDIFLNGKTYSSFTIDQLLVSEDGSVSIDKIPVSEGSLQNLLLDLRRFLRLVQESCLGGNQVTIIPMPFMRHLKQFVQHPPESIKESPEALKKYLSILRHHFAFAKVYDVYYLVIGLATAYSSFGSEDKAAFRSIVNDINKGQNWSWSGVAKTCPVLRKVFLFGHIAAKHNEMLGLFIFWRHSEIHGPQNCLEADDGNEEDVKLTEETADLKSASVNNAQVTMEKEQLLDFFLAESTSKKNAVPKKETMLKQPMESPVEIFYMLASPMGDSLAESITKIVMELEVSKPA
ncbi:hypothetical protein ACP4OV_015735 [Aristida adscensionis]